MGYDETLRDFRDFLKRPQELDEVRWLGLDYVEGEVKRPWESYDKAVLIKSFKNLEKIYLVLGVAGSGMSEDEQQGREANMERRERETVFVAPARSVEYISRAWTEFREAFGREDALMRDMAFQDNRKLEPFVLPPVEVVSKLSRGRR